jgi:hypothetical protein
MWLHNTGCPWDSETCDLAAGGGHLAELKWLHITGCPLDELTCEFAAEGGHLEVLTWLHNAGCPWDYDNVCAGRCGRAPGDAAVDAGAPLPVG